MHALRNIHAALVPEALLVDTQPVDARPLVAADGTELGTLDMREWLGTIRAVDALVDQTVHKDLFELRHEERYVVNDSFDDGPECAAIVRDWQGTHLASALAATLADTGEPVTVRQEVRLRLYVRGR